LVARESFVPPARDVELWPLLAITRTVLPGLAGDPSTAWWNSRPKVYSSGSSMAWQVGKKEIVATRPNRMRSGAGLTSPVIWAR